MQTPAQLVARYSAKASGVYREIIDASQTAEATAQYNVVVVGQFPQGPVMRPVLVRNANAAHAIFGKRNLKLESRGNYGMLMAEHLLEGGRPIWILNIKNIDQYTETLQARAIAVNSSETQAAAVSEKIATVYDTTKFWKVDEAYAKYGADGDVLTFAAVNEGVVSVVLMPYKGDDFNYTVAEARAANPDWDSTGYDDNALLADYMVKAYVFNADLTALGYATVAEEQIAALKELADAKFFAEYTGAIGDLISVNGDNLNIAVVMNADRNASGLHTAINMDAIVAHGIDLVGIGSIKYAADNASYPTVQSVTRLLRTATGVLTAGWYYIDTENAKTAYVFGEATEIYQGCVITNEAKSVRVLKKQYFANTTIGNDDVKVFKLELSDDIICGLAADAQTTKGGALPMAGTVGTMQQVVVEGITLKVAPYCLCALSVPFGNAVPCVLQGITDSETHYVNGTAARQKAVLDRLNDPGIMTGFTDPTIFKCRYMCDTFKTYIEPNAKYQYATLGDAAKRFLVFGPSPFYYELRTCKNPDFHDALGEFDMSYVAQGSNPDKPSTNTFSYAKAGGKEMYYMPIMNVKYNAGYGEKVVPVSGAVARTFYDKLLAGKVWEMVAGAEYPIAGAGIQDAEFESGPDDRAAMEKMGTNVLQKISGVLQLRSNKTAYQSVISAFNNPETLEKVFFVQDYVEGTLDGKLFKYNDDDARSTVVLKANEACDVLVAAGAIATYKNTCDLSNNTAEVRNAGIIVLDTELYNEKGIVIAVHRTTVHMAE